MYSKTGLSALAIAGLSFGVVGMLMGASGAATPPDCRAPSGGVTAPAPTGTNGTTPIDNAKRRLAGKKADRRKGGRAGIGMPTEGNGSKGPNGSSGSNGNGSNLVDVNGHTPNGGGANATVPSDGSAPTVGSRSGSSGSDPSFLDLQGNTDGVDTNGGSASVPPTGTHVVGRSSTLGSLVNVSGHTNTGR